MKNLMISIVCLLILTVPWSIYHKYSSETVDRYKAVIDQQVIPFAEMGDWDNAEKSFIDIIEDWNRYKKISAYFINTDAVNEVDCMIMKTLYHIRSRDPYNSIAEAAELKYRFEILHSNETPSPDNLL